MKGKIVNEWWGISVVLVFVVNVLKENSWLIAGLNAVIFGLSILVFKFKKPLLLLILALIPIFSFDIKNIWVNIGIIMILSLLGLLKIKKLNKICWCLIILIFIVINLLAARILNQSWQWDKSQLIFSINNIKEWIIYHQKDAVFLPYKARLLVYNPLIYLYYFLGNLGHLITFRNLSNLILMANLYPLFFGLKENKKKIVWLFLIISLVIAGIDRSPDKFNSLYALAPLFLYLIGSGFEKMNKKIYFGLLLLNLLVVLV